MVIYLAGSISNGDTENKNYRKKALEKARAVAEELWKKGLAVICPHLNNNFTKNCSFTWEDYLSGDILLIERVDALVMLPGWEKSRGATLEKAFAQRIGLPIYYYPDSPEAKRV